MLFIVLLQKITGRDLEYKALIGKPCEITYRYAEQVIADVAKRLGITRPIRKLYFVGYVYIWITSSCELAQNNC